MHKILSKLSVLVILTVILLDKTWADGEKNICGSCQEFLGPCHIKSETGFAAEKRIDLHKILVFNGWQTKNENRKDLIDCVPALFKISGDLNGSVCFWSPSVGCKMLLGTEIQKSNISDIDCVECLMHCPCSQSAPRCSVNGKVALLFAAIVFHVYFIIYT